MGNPFIRVSSDDWWLSGNNAGFEEKKFYNAFLFRMAARVTRPCIVTSDPRSPASVPAAYPSDIRQYTNNRILRRGTRLQYLPFIDKTGEGPFPNATLWRLTTVVLTAWPNIFIALHTFVGPSASTRELMISLCAIEYRPRY